MRDAATCQTSPFFRKNATNGPKIIQNPPKIEPKSLKIRPQIEKNLKNAMQRQESLRIKNALKKKRTLPRVTPPHP